MNDLADEDFVGVGAIGIGGIEHGDAAVNGVVDDLDHVGFWLRWSIIGRHPHASQPQR